MEVSGLAPVQIGVRRHQLLARGTPKPGKRTTLFGTPIPDAFFENEPDEAAVLASEKISETQIDKEEAAIDALLDGDDGALDDLEY